MPRYYFHLVKGQERIRDHQGMDFPEALNPDLVAKVIEEIQVERPDLLDGSQRGWRLEIEDDAGHVIRTIQL
jgi:hypothetical protein